MKTILVNYADAKFAPYQAINSLTGRRFGFDECRSFGPADIDADFARRNAETLSLSRLAGYALWKPYVIARTLAELREGDVLCYADSGTHFVNPIDPMISLLDQHDLDLLILAEGFTEGQYTKRDAFILMQADEERFVRSRQRFSSYFLLRKSAWADDFIARFLACAEDDRILTDKPNTRGLPNYPEFIAHRHDQSIFSLLSKQEDVPVVQRGLNVLQLPDRANQIINHTRLHQTPNEILRYLLDQGVLSLADVQSLETSMQRP